MASDSLILWHASIYGNVLLNILHFTGNYQVSEVGTNIPITSLTRTHLGFQGFQLLKMIKPL